MYINNYMETNWMELGKTLKTGSENERLDALVIIKDAVIGSNRQKGALICHELVPAIISICTGKNESLQNRMEALIILGSLAKGSADQVKILVERYNIIPILIKEILLENNNKKCIEICLSTMQSIYELPDAPVDGFFTDACSLTYFLGLASPSSSFKTQICVTTILVSLCQTYDDQIRFLQAGTIHVLARMICCNNEQVQVSALRCLSHMCYANRSVTDNICVTSFEGKSLPDILNTLLSRLAVPESQLTAARCLTNIYRSGTLLSTDHRIISKTLPALARLCSDSFDQAVRADAAATLAYLIEINSELQRTASISNSLLKSLSQLLQSEDSTIKQAALRCFASLGANDEAIRKRIMDTYGLIDAVIEGLKGCDPQVRLASIRCLHSLSRSVQQLRTTFQDFSVWKLLLTILNNQPTMELLIAVSTIMCNLLLEFSPSKDHLLGSGILEILCQLIEHKDNAVRLNSVWAFMNMSFQADQQVKSDIVNALGIQKILELLQDADACIVLKAAGLLRNLLCKSYHIDFVMHGNSGQILSTFNSVFDSNHSTTIKEQLMCVVAHIAVDAQYGDDVINDDRIMRRLGEYLYHSDYRLQAIALFVLKNIIKRKDTWSKETLYRLKELNIISSVYDLNKKVNRNKQLYEEFITRTLKDIISQCKNLYPEIID